MRMSSIMRWRSGLMSWLRVVMARLLSSNEADCLINQHRKQSWFPTKNYLLQTECIPRERFSPLAEPGLMTNLGLQPKQSLVTVRSPQGQPARKHRNENAVLEDKVMVEASERMKSRKP